MLIAELSYLSWNWYNLRFVAQNICKLNRKAIKTICNLSNRIQFSTDCLLIMPTFSKPDVFLRIVRISYSRWNQTMLPTSGQYSQVILNFFKNQLIYECITALSAAFVLPHMLRELDVFLKECFKYLGKFANLHWDRLLILSN